MATQTTSTSYETFLAYARLAGFTDEKMIRDIFDAGQSFLSENVDPGSLMDVIAMSDKAPESYKSFLKNFYNIKSLNVGVTTVSEYMAAKNAYKTTFQKFGLQDMATDENIDKFLTNQVSVDEAYARLNTAFNAINNADAALKQQLATYFPSLTTKDIVANILGVGKSVSELQKMIDISGIKAEAATAGIQSTLSPEELLAQGVNRATARQGFQNVAASLPGFEAAAARAGEQPSTIQTELEKEQLLGLRSQRRAQLTTREQGLFAGQSGANQNALRKASTGKI